MIFVEVLYFGGDLSESLPGEVKQPRTRCLKSASEDRKAASKHARPSDQETCEWIERTSRADNHDRCDLSEYLPDVLSMPCNTSFASFGYGERFIASAICLCAERHSPAIFRIA